MATALVSWRPPVKVTESILEGINLQHFRYHESIVIRGPILGTDFPVDMNALLLLRFFLTPNSFTWHSVHSCDNSHYSFHFNLSSHTFSSNGNSFINCVIKKRILFVTSVFMSLRFQMIKQTIYFWFFSVSHWLLRPYITCFYADITHCEKCYFIDILANYFN